MYRILPTLLTAMIVGVLSPGAFADEATGPAAAPPQLPERFKSADADGDGFLSRSEAPRRVGAQFKRIDANGDGKLNGNELTPGAQPLDPFNKPLTPLVGVSPRFYVWYSLGKWYLRTASNRRGGTKFEGTIVVNNGEFQSWGAPSLEGRGDLWEPSQNRKQLKFTFRTVGKSDGFDFTIKRSTTPAQLEFTLICGGKEAPNCVFVGQSGGHPKSIPFTLDARPEK